MPRSLSAADCFPKREFAWGSYVLRALKPSMLCYPHGGASEKEPAAKQSLKVFVQNILAESS